MKLLPLHIRARRDVKALIDELVLCFGHLGDPVLLRADRQNGEPGGLDCGIDVLLAEERALIHREIDGLAVDPPSGTRRS